MNKYCIFLCLLLSGCRSQQHVTPRVIPPTPTTPSYTTNVSIPVFEQRAIVQPPSRITNAISLSWDISPADMGSTIYLIYGTHNVNSPQTWTYIGSTTGLVCTITNINLAPMSVFKVVASNTYTHITSEQLIHQLQQQQQ